jgi:hypothetical protein
MAKNPLTDWLTDIVTDLLAGLKTTAVATTAKIGVLMARRSLTVRIILREMDLKRRGRARDRRR